MILTYFRALRNPVGQRVETTWPKLLDRLKANRVIARKEDTPGLSLASYIGNRRALANVEHVYAIGLDLDYLGVLSIRTKHEPGETVHVPTWGQLCLKFAEVDSFLHTTWSSRPDAVRARVYLLLSRPVTAAEYRRVYAACAGHVEEGGLVVDRQASDPSRFWYLPSTPPGGRIWYSVGTGKPIDVEGALRLVPEEPPPPAPAPRPPRETTTSGADVEERAERYVDHCEPAISGQGGHAATFVLAQRVVLGFALDDAAALRVLLRWNQRCVPPWSERALVRKIREARERGNFPLGSLRDRPLRRAS